MNGADDASYNIVVAGTGGQGVMTASEVLAQTALAAGYDVKKTDAGILCAVIGLHRGSADPGDHESVHG